MQTDISSTPAMAERKVPYEAVGQVESDYSHDPPSYHSKRTAKEKLGVYNIVVLIIGTLVILLGVAFLAFIWIVSINGTYTKDGLVKTNMPTLWKLIATHGWVPRAITLSTILIRAATAAHLCVFAAIMAALILERVGASSQDFPLLSMIRCANTGPQALIWNVLRTIKTGAQKGYSALIMITILNAIALQFTSTILLADLTSISVVLNETTYSDIFYGMSDNGEANFTNTYAGVDFWKTGPQLYPRFAERAGNASNGTNFTDTGAVYRGFIPFNDPNTREDLRSYYGPMEVFDARVVCVKPTLSNVRLWPYFTDNDTDLSDAEYILSGNLNIDGVYPSGINTTPLPGSNLTNMYTDFNCSAPVASLNLPSGTYGNGSICVLGTGYAQLLNPIIPEKNDSQLPFGTTIAQLFINGTVVTDNYSALAPNSTTLQQMDTSQKGWARFGNKDMTFDMSYCFFNPRSQDYEVIAVASYDWSDNVAFWDNSTGVNVLNTSYIESALDGTTNDTVDDRGQMTLYPQDIYGPWTNSTAAKWLKQNATSVILDSLLLNNDDFGITYQLSPFSMTSETMHRLHADLFTKLIRTNNNPALAIQGLWTVLLQMAYYDFFGLYDAHDDAYYGISVPLNIPWRYNCFIGIMCLLALHFCLIIAAVVLFLKKTEMSLLGNSWQAVSQVMSHETANTVHHGAMRTDQEMLKTSRDAPQRMYIGRSDATGRTEAMSAMLPPVRRR